MRVSEQLTADLQAITDAARATIGSLIYPVYNVLGYGAKGDGVTDDTSAIQAAIDAASAAGGGIVFFPSGTHLTDAEVGLQLKSNLRILLSPNAVIKAKPTANGTYNIFNGVDVQNVTIIGGVIEGDRDEHLGSTGEHGMGINLKGVTRVHVEGTRIRDCWGDGIYIGSSAAQRYSKDVTLKDVEIFNCRRQGISVISVKGLRVIRPNIHDINGTSPESGIDLEPNGADEFMEGVRITDPITENCAAYGITVNFGQLAGSGKAVDVRITGHHDTGSLVGFGVQKLNGVVSGNLIVEDLTTRSNQLAGIGIRNYDVQGARIEFHRPIVVDPNTDGEAPLHYGSGIVIYREATDVGAATIGNVHIYRPTVMDTRGVPKILRAIYVVDLASGSVSNVTIKDPISFSGVTAVPVLLGGGGEITDQYHLLEKDATDTVSLYSSNYFRTVHNASATGLVTVVLKDSIPASWTDLTFEVRAAQTLRVDPESGAQRIRPLANPGKYLEASVPGSRLTLRRMSGGDWYVLEQIGTWTVEP